MCEQSVADGTGASHLCMDFRRVNLVEARAQCAEPLGAGWYFRSDHLLGNEEGAALEQMRHLRDLQSVRP